jgi:hypothetical protein
VQADLLERRDRDRDLVLCRDTRHSFTKTVKEPVMPAARLFAPSLAGN